jgi:hypothetical protein
MLDALNYQISVYFMQDPFIIEEKSCKFVVTCRCRTTSFVERVEKRQTLKNDDVIHQVFGESPTTGTRTGTRKKIQPLC